MLCRPVGFISPPTPLDLTMIGTLGHLRCITGSNLLLNIPCCYSTSYNKCPQRTAMKISYAPLLFWLCRSKTPEVGRPGGRGGLDIWNWGTRDSALTKAVPRASGCLEMVPKAARRTLFGPVSDPCSADVGYPVESRDVEWGTPFPKWYSWNQRVNVYQCSPLPAF